MNRRKIILRADGNPKIGLGHVYRLLALAQILKNDFDCFFAINNPDSFTQLQIEKICKGTILIEGEIAYQLPENNKPGDSIPFDMANYINGDEIVVTDGYLFGKDYQVSIKATGAKLVCIDDLAQTDFYADILINHAPGIDSSIYKKQPYTKIYTGLNYMILRQPFFTPQEKKRELDERIFISMGGSDYFGFTKKILEILLELKKNAQFDILCSSSFDKILLNNLNEIAEQHKNVLLHYNVDANNLVQILDKCTHAVVTASTVLLEAYSRGLKCFAGYYTKNQHFLYAGFCQQHFAVGLGHFESFNKKTFIDAIAAESGLLPLTAELQSERNLQDLFISLNKE